ncbi:hypothetical protein BSKO_09893 [Bryopsis sp. KO-2023]|nr:hypothetical protein BSKO_09893 [Bryopsis sp. KO-2023]
MGSVLFVVLFACVVFQNTHAVPVPVADGKALVPADSLSCVATRLSPGDAPVVDCDLAEPGSEEDTFTTATIVDLSSPFARCEIGPSSSAETGFEFDCSPFPAIELEKPVVKGRTLEVSEGAVSCEVTGLQKCRRATPVAVNCKGAKPSDDSPRFGKGVVFEFPEGATSRCDITAGPDGQIVQSCVGSPLLAIAEPVVEEGKVTLPAGATNCEVIPGGDDNEPVVTCAALVGGCSDPTFEEGAMVDLPADFDSDTTCTIEAVEGGEPKISCKLPPKVPVFEDGTLSIPEGIASCEVTGLEECIKPALTKASCKYADPNSDVPKFGKSATFNLLKGFSRCVLTPREGDEAFVDCTPTPPSETILKETINGRSVTLPVGAVSCTVTPAEEEGDYEVECVGVTEGCNDPEFEEETVTTLPKDSFESCTVTPRKGKPFVACETGE